jgi:inosose dehydratase
MNLRKPAFDTSPPGIRRREILASLGACVASAGTAWAKPKDRQAPMSIGCAAITWGDENARQAIADIGAVGYRGVQLRAGSLSLFAEPAALAEELARARLTFVCLSLGPVSLDSKVRDAEVEKFVKSARFAHAAGALSLQATSPAHPAGELDRKVLSDFAATLNEIGKRTADVGVPLGFHPQVNQVGRTTLEVDALLGATDPRFVKLVLDTGHHAAAGGDPARAIETHGDRLLLMHFKDTKPVALNSGDDSGFVELGLGKVNFRRVLAALRARAYAGWIVVEMRPYSVRADRSAKELATANKAYLERKLGLRV